MTNLRSKLIRLAHFEPHLRPHLLPLLRLASKSGWQLVRERADVAHQVWDMYEKSYASLGLIVASVQGLITEFPIWEVFFGDDEVPQAFVLSKSTPKGIKLGLIGSDGSSGGKGLVKEKIRAFVHQPHYYAEVSHAVAKIALSANPPVVCNTYVPDVLGKSVSPSPDGLHYKRNLAGVGLVEKILVGSPSGVPTTTASNPSCPVPLEDEVRTGSETCDDDVCDRAAHLTCLLDLDD